MTRINRPPLKKSNPWYIRGIKDALEGKPFNENIANIPNSDNFGVDAVAEYQEGYTDGTEHKNQV